MITFNVGPSRIKEEVKEDIKDAIKKDILEISHRSEEFTNVSKEAVLKLKELFSIPDEYGVIFTSSATESMQLAVQNCCRDKAFHFVSGNFSKLFAEISRANHKEVDMDLVENGQINNFKDTNIDKDVDFIAVTQNETSTGVMCSVEEIESLRESNANTILAVDITSSAGSVEFDFTAADIWLFSVQKCLGLPSGLGVLILSPKAFERSKELELVSKGCAGIFTFEKLNAKMIEKYQTFSTPNILGIYLLSRVCGRFLKNGGIKNISLEMEDKVSFMDKFVSENDEVEYFVKDRRYRSKTVFCLKAKKSIVEKLHTNCREKGLLLGKGYGELKEDTIRIANFPAISKEDLKRLVDCMKEILKSS